MHDNYAQQTERWVLRKLTEADALTGANFFIDNPNAI